MNPAGAHGASYRTDAGLRPSRQPALLLALLIPAALGAGAAASGCHLVVPYRSTSSDASGAAESRWLDLSAAEDRASAPPEASVPTADRALPGEGLAAADLPGADRDLTGADLPPPRDAGPADAGAPDVKPRPTACVQDLTAELCTSASCTGSCPSAGASILSVTCTGAPGAYLCQCDSSSGYATCTSAFAGNICLLCAAVPDLAFESCCF